MHDHFTVRLPLPPLHVVAEVPSIVAILALVRRVRPARTNACGLPMNTGRGRARAAGGQREDEHQRNETRAEEVSPHHRSLLQITPRRWRAATAAVSRPRAPYTRALCSPSRGGNASGGGSPTGGGGSAIVRPVRGSRTRTSPGATSGSVITSGRVATRPTGPAAPRSSAQDASVISLPSP